MSSTYLQTANNDSAKMVRHAENLRRVMVELAQSNYERMMDADYKLSLAYNYEPSKVAERQKELDVCITAFVEGMRQYELAYEHKCPIKERE